MDIITTSWDSVVAHPMAGVMALVAFGCAITAIRARMRVGDRFAAAVLAVMSGISAWMLEGIASSNGLSSAYEVRTAACASALHAEPETLARLMCAWRNSSRLPQPCA